MRKGDIKMSTLLKLPLLDRVLEDRLTVSYATENSTCNMFTTLSHASFPNLSYQFLLPGFKIKGGDGYAPLLFTELGDAPVSASISLEPPFDANLTIHGNRKILSIGNNFEFTLFTPLSKRTSPDCVFKMNHNISPKIGEFVVFWGFATDSRGLTYGASYNNSSITANATIDDSIITISASITDKDNKYGLHMAGGYTSIYTFGLQTLQVHPNLKYSAYLDVISRSLKLNGEKKINDNLSIEAKSTLGRNSMYLAAGVNYKYRGFDLSLRASTAPTIGGFVTYPVQKNKVGFELGAEISSRGPKASFCVSFDN